MKQILKSALESAGSLQNDEVGLTDDLEFDTVSYAAEHMVESFEAYHEAIRASEDMIERIENVGLIIDCDPVPNDQSRALIDEGLSAALSGSETKVSDLIPNLHEENSVLSTESIRSTISNALSRILSYIKRILADMSALWSNMVSMSKWVKFTAENGLNRVKTSKGMSPSQSSFSFKGDPNRLMINGAVYKSNAILLANLVEMRRQLEYFTGDYTKLVNRIGEGFLGAMKSGGSPEDTLKKCIDACLLMNYSTVSGNVRARNQRDPRFDGGVVDAAPALLGNRSVFVPKEIVPSGHASLLGQAQESRKRSIVLLHTNEQQKTMGDASSLPVMSPTEAESVLKEVVKIASLVDEYDSRKHRELVRKINDITDAYKKLCERNAEHNENNNDRAHHNSVGRYVTQFSSMVTSPTDSLIVHALSCCRMVIALANRSMQYYR